MSAIVTVPVIVTALGPVPILNVSGPAEPAVQLLGDANENVCSVSLLAQAEDWALTLLVSSSAETMVETIKARPSECATERREAEGELGFSAREHDGCDLKTLFNLSTLYPRR